MSITLRIILLLAAIAVAVTVLRSVKKSKMRIEDTLFWTIVVFIVLLLGLFPQIVTFCASALGIASEQNFVFLLFIFILLVNAYRTSRATSNLETKIKELTQQIAIDRLSHRERRED